MDGLPVDWVPETLGTRAEVDLVLADVLSQFTKLDVRCLVEDAHESPDPRAITVSGHFGPSETAAIKQLCSRFGAVFFDAENGWLVGP